MQVELILFLATTELIPRQDVLDGHTQTFSGKFYHYVMLLGGKENS